MNFPIDETNLSKRTLNVVLRHFTFCHHFDKEKLGQLTLADALALTKKADSIRHLGPAAIAEIVAFAEKAKMDVGDLEGT